MPTEETVRTPGTTRLLFAALLAGCSSPMAGGSADSGADGHENDGSSDSSMSSTRPRVVLIIGDGVGIEQEIATSRFVHGEPNELAWHSFDSRSELLTASASGITDSAAAATAMATGHTVFNGQLALDRHGNPLESVFDVARNRGLARGVVTTATISHATIAAFSARGGDRYNYPAIAAQQVGPDGPTVMFGGGRNDFAPHLSALASAGAQIVETADELDALEVDPGARTIGLFADDQLEFANDRATQTDVPDLATMALQAIKILDRDPDGFILVVEGARIDRACHDLDIENAIGDLAELDRAATALIDWAVSENDVTVLFASDHETGGLQRLDSNNQGELPVVGWRWNRHSNKRVRVAGFGPKTDALVGGPHDPRIVHAVITAAIEQRPIEIPPTVFIANGDINEHGPPVAIQQRSPPSGNASLERLFVGADRFGITLGIEGWFSTIDSSLVILIDRDFGTSTGARSFISTGTTSTLAVDQLLARFSFDMRSIGGFGADFVVVSVAASEADRESDWSGASWRNLVASNGLPSGTPPLGVALTYDQDARLGTFAPRRGAELSIAFDAMFGSTGIPIGAELAFLAISTSVLGSSNSNQALPSLASGTEIPTAVVVIELDVNRDGVVDSSPRVRLESGI